MIFFISANYTTRRYYRFTRSVKVRELLSISIVAPNGNQFYAINKAANMRPSDESERLCVENLLNYTDKSMYEIAHDLFSFIFMQGAEDVDLVYYDDTDIVNTLHELHEKLKMQYAGQYPIDKYRMRDLKNSMGLICDLADKKFFMVCDLFDGIPVDEELSYSDKMELISTAPSFPEINQFNALYAARDVQRVQETLDIITQRIVEFNAVNL